MKEVDTFFCSFFVCLFFAKDGVPQSVFVQECFVYMYLQTDIHKQRLQTLECVFCERFIAPPPFLSPLNSKQSLYKQSDYTVKKKKKKVNRSTSWRDDYVTVRECVWLDGWVTQVWRHRRCYRVDSIHTPGCFNLQLFILLNKLLAAPSCRCALWADKHWWHHAPLRICFHQSEQSPCRKQGPLTRY